LQKRDKEKAMKSKDVRKLDEGVSRRNFLKAAAISVAGATALGVTGCASQDSAAERIVPDWLPTDWDGEADVIVVGMGAAGLSATITTLDENLGEVILLEAGSDSEAGGNSRCCGALTFCPDDVEKAIEYQTSLNGFYEVDPALMRVWAEGVCENKKWLENLGAEVIDMHWQAPEFPEKPGSESIHTYCVDGTMGQQVGWTFMKETALSLGAQIIYETRVTSLITNPETREIVGVSSEDGQNFKARKAVVLATGGFENNPEMLRNYFRGTASTVLFWGGALNRGDGIIMAQSVGADLWHMNNYAGLGLGARATAADANDGTYMRFTSHDFIFVGPSGERFMYEERNNGLRHGYAPIAGGFDIASIPFTTYAIFGKEAFEGGLEMNFFTSAGWRNVTGNPPANDAASYLDNEIIVKADTPRELAEKIGIDPDGLEATIATYTGYVAANNDPDYGRGHELRSPGEEKPIVERFDLVPITPPYYALEQCHTLLNSQGGPKRGVNGEVLDTKGQPIPRLYAAGEMGTVYGYLYNGGGNWSECLASGRLAARSANSLDIWEA
jgi:succinate dehydrogenase/fumarate reductase flavoprotein subunit